VKFHHLGIACESIDETLAFVKATHAVIDAGEAVYDPRQDATVRMITIADGPKIELISGKRVEGILKRKINLYHICYEVSNLDAAVAKILANGGTILAEAKEAALFDNRRVAFVLSPIGILEFLEG
jgi:methylmalonyl-CoA/ethylmalonyl-CoA epimerase